MSRALCGGIVVALCGFVLIFYAAAHVLTVLPRLETSPLFVPLTNAVTWLALMFACLKVQRDRRRRRPAGHAAHRPAFPRRYN